MRGDARRRGHARPPERRGREADPSDPSDPSGPRGLPGGLGQRFRHLAGNRGEAVRGGGRLHEPEFGRLARIRAPVVMAPSDAEETSAAYFANTPPG